MPPHSIEVDYVVCTPFILSENHHQSGTISVNFCDDHQKSQKKIATSDDQNNLCQN